MTEVRLESPASRESEITLLRTCLEKNQSIFYLGEHHE